MGWLEERIDYRDYVGLTKIRDMLVMQVTVGEHYYTAAQLCDLHEAQALVVVILDLAWVGDKASWRKLGAIGEVYNIPVYGHVVLKVHVNL